MIDQFLCIDSDIRVKCLIPKTDQRSKYRHQNQPVMFFILGGNVLTYGCYYFSGKKDGKPYWIFTLLYMTSNIWSFQFYFSLQQAEVAFAMLLMAIPLYIR